MIGLTCSWAWSMGPVLSPSCLCVLTSQIVKRRRGAEPVSISFFLSIISCLPLCVYFSPRSLCPLSLMTNLSAAPVVVESGCSACEWMRCTVFFFLYENISVCPAQCLRSCSISHQFLIWTQMEGFLFGWCRREGSLHFASLHSVVPFWKSLRLETWCHAVLLTSAL